MSVSKEINHAELRGDDAWIGRRIKKEFPDHGTFFGIVTAVDDHEGHPGERIFLVKHFDGDEEDIAVKDLKDLLVDWKGLLEI